MDYSAQVISTGILNKLSHEASFDLEWTTDEDRFSHFGTTDRPEDREQYFVKIEVEDKLIRSKVKAISSEPKKEFYMEYDDPDAAVSGISCVIEDLINHSP